MKKYIRTGVGEEIETFLEWFFENKKLYAESSNGCIRGWKLDDDDDDIIQLKLKIKLGK